MISTTLSFSVKALGNIVKRKDLNALHNKLKNDYVITKAISGSIALGCGHLVALLNAFVIILKHIDFSAEELHHPSRDSDGYPVDEVPTAKQSPVTSE